jgi:crotonobetaine/carnitine-CoA ligase
LTITYPEWQPVISERANWNLPYLLRLRAATHGPKVFLEFPQTGESYSFAQTLELSERVAANLVEAGVGVGDRVLVMAPNCTSYVFAWFGANLAGAVEVPINTAYRGSFLEHQVRTTGPRVAIIHSDFATRFIEIAEACQSIAAFYVIGAEGVTDMAIGSLRAAGWTAAPVADLLVEDRTDLPAARSSQLANIFFTSGTTGASKGVMMPFGQVHMFGEEIVSVTRLTEDDTVLATGPMFHGNTCFQAIQPCLIVGGRVVLYEKFSPSRWAGWVRSSGATVTNFVGVMMDWVAKVPPADNDADNNLRCICAVPVASSIVEAFKTRFGVREFVEIYGSTEQSLPLMTPYGVERPDGACGAVVSQFYDVRVADPDTDEEVPVGVVGELLSRPRLPWTSALGYYAMPDRTADAFRNLWFHSGDGVRRDGEGWYYFVDRIKDSIRRRGENISSYELEQAVLKHPEVAECAVIAVPADGDGGEDEVMLFAIPQAGTQLTPDVLWTWADDNLPTFMIPRFIKIVETLPKTPSEKVQKAELRRIAAASEQAERKRST